MNTFGDNWGGNVSPRRITLRYDVYTMLGVSCSAFNNSEVTDIEKMVLKISFMVVRKKKY